MALDLKLPKLQETSLATGDATEVKETVSYEKKIPDLSDAEAERRIEISRKLLSPHKYIPADKPNFARKDVEFFDLSRRWRKTPLVFEKVLKPLGLQISNTFLKDIDKYPAGYNPYVHGPYVPYRYYGKVDTPFLDTKVGDMSQWLSRRNMGPMGTVGLLRRAVWKYKDRWVNVTNFNGAAFFHVMLMSLGLFYIFEFEHKKENRHAKYH